MTAGPSQHRLAPTAAHASRPRPPQKNDQTFRDFFDHSKAPRIFSDAVIVDSLRTEYPELHLTVVPTWSCDVLGFAAAEKGAGVVPIDKEKERLKWTLFFPPATRLDGGKGVIADSVKFGKYLLDWKEKEYVVYLVEGNDGPDAYTHTNNQYILSPSVEATNRLVTEAGIWSNELHNEVWVFDGGFWEKSWQLFRDVQKASWDDVILDEEMKDDIIGDVDTFFDSRENYQKFKVPWKRGIIYYGPPGNGKTISIKAMMHMLYDRDPQIPTLYVKSLVSWAGPEYSINKIFERARREAPCYLVFEDLDSLVTDDVRSYFLNAVDGIQRNDGILMVGSTNYLERLDPGIAKRPSRFDRKYFFPNPTEEEREKYMQYWQGKLDDNDDVEFPDKICAAVAKITQGFSFAYLQEAVVASLLAIAREQNRKTTVYSGRRKNGAAGERSFNGLSAVAWIIGEVDKEDPDLDNYVLWRELKKQIRILRDELGDEKVIRR